MPKAPFERIFSLSERKKILTKVAKDNLKIVIKKSVLVFSVSFNLIELIYFCTMLASLQSKIP